MICTRGDRVKTQPAEGHFILLLQNDSNYNFVY